MDPKKRKEQEDAARKRELDAAAEIAQYRANLGWLLGHFQGRAFVWTMLVRMNAFSREFLPDPNMMYFRDGQQSEAMFLIREIMTVNPDAYYKMWAENHKGEK